MDGRSEARVYVGWDWATDSHQVCVLDLEGKVLSEFMVKHSGEGLADACSRLVGLAGGDPGSVWIAIETSHGAAVETLMDRGMTVFAINPKQVDRFRDRHTMAGAKDDRRDAYVLADSLRTDSALFRRLEPEDPTVVELREWSRMLEDLRQEHGRLSNRIRQQLVRYYPQALEVSRDVGKDWFLDLLDTVPTPAKAHRVRETTIDRLLKSHRVRRVDGAGVLAILRQQAVVVAPGTTQAATAHIRLGSDRLRVVNRQLKHCEKRIDQLIRQLSRSGSASESPEGEKHEQRDAEILQSLPGVGRIVLATLLGEAARPLRERDYQMLRSLAGVAPVTRASGKRRCVVMRQACHPRLRNACYHWARIAAQCDPWARASYQALRERSKSHGRALRGVADRLLRVAMSMLRTGQPFDASRLATRRP